MKLNVCGLTELIWEVWGGPRGHSWGNGEIIRLITNILIKVTQTDQTESPDKHAERTFMKENTELVLKVYLHYKIFYNTVCTCDLEQTCFKTTVHLIMDTTHSTKNAKHLMNVDSLLLVAALTKTCSRLANWFMGAAMPKSQRLQNKTRTPSCSPTRRRLSVSMGGETHSRASWSECFR